MAAACDAKSCKSIVTKSPTIVANTSSAEMKSAPNITSGMSARSAPPAAVRTTPWTAPRDVRVPTSPKRSRLISRALPNAA